MSRGDPCADAHESPRDISLSARPVRGRRTGHGPAPPDRWGMPLGAAQGYRGSRTDLSSRREEARHAHHIRHTAAGDRGARGRCGPDRTDGGAGAAPARRPVPGDRRQGRAHPGVARARGPGPQHGDLRPAGPRRAGARRGQSRRAHPAGTGRRPRDRLRAGAGGVDAIPRRADLRAVPERGAALQDSHRRGRRCALGPSLRVPRGADRPVRPRRAAGRGPRWSAADPGALGDRGRRGEFPGAARPGPALRGDHR